MRRRTRIALSPRELDFLREIAGKQVCVLGSGDNQAVFALAGLGAAVTSVDISERQLSAAKKRAAQLNLTITFLRADVTDLAALPDGGFDLVYTGGHVAVWVSDLQQYYREAVRILKPGGLFMVNEYHPFRRPWRDSPDRLELAWSYFDRGPHEYTTEDETGASAPDDPPQREFHWTVSDYVMTILSAGCELLLLDESGEEAEDWEGAPLTGLPESLLIVARKGGFCTD